MPNLYETLLIVTPEADDAGVNAVIGDLRATIEADGGTVLQAGVWEKRKLAYQVKGKTEGIYVLIYADGDNTLPAALKDRMKLDEAVIRSIVVRLEDLQEADVRQAIAEADHSHDAEDIAAQLAAAEARQEAEAAAAAMSLDEMVAAEEEATVDEGAAEDAGEGEQAAADPGADEGAVDDSADAEVGAEAGADADAEADPDVGAVDATAADEAPADEPAAIDDGGEADTAEATEQDSDDEEKES